MADSNITHPVAQLNFNHRFSAKVKWSHLRNLWTVNIFRHPVTRSRISDVNKIKNDLSENNMVDACKL